MSWLSPLKPLVVVAALGGVAWVVYVVTTSEPPVAPEGATSLEDIPAMEDMTGGVPMELPAMDVASDATPGGAAPSWTPPPAGNASTSPQGLPDFGTPDIPAFGGPGAELPSQTLDSAAPVSSSDDFGPPSDFNPPAEFSNAPPAQVTAPLAQVAAPPVVDAFATSMQQAQALLDQNQLAQALRLLSELHQTAQLTPAQRQQLSELLDQVAGTVIYSQEHRLLDAHTVAANETLESIAARYQVPQGLLAKINGIAAPTQLNPGDQLKVVQGPFNAEVNLEAGELTLMLDGYYAGRFQIETVPGIVVNSGPYVVQAKSGMHSLQLSPRLIGPGKVGTVLGAHGPRVALKLTPRDAEDVASILSNGSNVVIR